MASGPLASPPGMKFFFYASEPEDLLSAATLYLAQATLISATGEFNLILKIADSKNISLSSTRFQQVLVNALGRFAPQV